jgi:diguanylate cyclase (GGDEF)-like protein
MPVRALQTIRAWMQWRSGTIRSQIFLAFLAISAITATLGGYATFGIRNAGTLVTKTFDETLMSINYARAAAADFAAVQAVFLRREASPDPIIRQRLDDQIETLIDTLNDDLSVAADRSQSVRAARAAENVKEAAAEWSKLRRRLHDTSSNPSTWKEIDGLAETVNQQIDLLVNYTAGDGFLYRQDALKTVENDIRLNLIGTALALLFAALVSWLLTKRIIGPVAVASSVAKRIADGDLDVTVTSGGNDELGTLLAAMGTMRDNIRTMMEREISERRSAQAQLADSLESSREGIIVLNAEGRVTLANSQAIEFLHDSPDLLSETRPTGYEDSDDASHHIGDDKTGEAQLTDGRWLRVSRSKTHDDGMIVVFSDISALKEQKAKLRDTNLRLDAALDNMSQGLCFFDRNDKLKVVNRRFCEIFSLSPEAVQPGISFIDILTLSIAAGNHEGKTLDEVILERDSHIHEEGSRPFLQELSSGKVISISQTITSDGGWVATYEDVTEQRRAESRIAFMARHDALTSLPNRALFRERIEQAVSHANRGNGFSVLSVDLDQFKPVNDTLGHPVGDKLLETVAQRLLSCVREVDTVARLGGDEFAIVQCNVHSPEDAGQLARRIVDSISKPFEIDGNRITIGCSVGISVAPGDGTSSEKLLKNADVALYRAKTDGRGTWRFFEPEMDARLQARRALELDLREGLNQNQFEVFYQPLYDLDKDRFSGCEALVRWRHPMRGLVPPDQFVSIAEEIGLITTLGEQVLRRACDEASRWPSGMKVAVNVSPVQFRSPNLVQIVRSALTASGLPAQRLELEITESVLLANSAATIATLHELRALGVRVALDDFGTGYSSLSYLRSFPFDKIKIDRTFVRDLSAVDSSKLIVRAIINLSKNLGIMTTAEGVESQEQLEQLRLEGCDEVQGFLFGRPVPLAKLPPSFMAGRKKKPRPVLRAV